MQTAELELWSRQRDEILAAVRKGEDAPLRRFYDAHFAEVYRYVLCRVDGNHAEAEDIAADVFFQAFRDIEGYDGKRDPAAWLRGIARHRVLDFYRREGRRPVVELVFSRFDEQFTKRLFDLEAAELPEAELERNELGRVVELVLSELPGDYEKVLRLHYVEEHPVKELAEILATTPKAAEARLWRAREAFCAAFRLAGRNLDFSPDGGGNRS